MPRLMLSDEHWPKLREILLQESIYNKRNLRMTVEGMLYRMRTGCPWRDLPQEFGGWARVYKRFNAWSASGKWSKVLDVLMIDPDMEWVFIASLIAKVPGAEAIIADKGYDSEAIRAQIERQGSQIVIPRKRNSRKGNADLERGLYRYRHLVENAFARLKHFRAVASRFDKLKRNYESVIAMACAFLWLPM